MLQNTLINHIIIVVDKSGSMEPHASRVVEVFDRELQYLKQRSVDLNQETRVSIYLFGSEVEVLAFDMDVMRFGSLKEFYRISGMTALIDATVQAIKDNRKLPELYGDHAFLLYVITDGEENRSRVHTQAGLAMAQDDLPDNWTSVILVPDARGEQEALRFGFHSGAIRRWDTTQGDAFDSVGRGFRGVVDSYMDLRSQGIRGTRNLFELDPSNLTKKSLKILSSKSYEVYPVRKDDMEIRDYVEQVTKKDYLAGSTYFVPTKPVIVQQHKHFLVRERKTGKIYESDDLRNVLGLPPYEVKVKPDDNKDWEIFIQSTSFNRHLKKGSDIIVRK